MRYHYNVNRGVTHLKTKATLAIMAFGLLFGSAAMPLTLLGSANAAPPVQSAWNVNGNYTFDFEYQGGHYVHSATISGFSPSTGAYTISGNYPTSLPYQQEWSGTGVVNGNTSVANNVTYTYGATGTHMLMSGVIGSDGKMSGSWTDNYGGTRVGTWTTATGAAKKFTKNDCMKNGWVALGFRNQGQCVSYTVQLSDVVYDATSAIVPPNVASLGYEATSTPEFGDQVHLAGTNRKLNTVTVTMSDWAKYSEYSTDSRYSANNVSWTHPITVNIYSNNLVNGLPDTLLASTTQTVTIPWSPAGDPSCVDTGYGTGFAWRASDGKCYNGKAFNASFDMSGLNVNLPDDVIVTVAYNTADYGQTPIHQAGPYNSLNVGVPNNQIASIGYDDNTDAVFWNTSVASFYADGGLAGVGTLRQDTNWTPNGTVAFKITAEDN